MDFELPTALLVSRITGYGALLCLGISLGLSSWRKMKARRWWGMRSAELALAHGVWGVWGFLGWGNFGAGFALIHSQSYLRLGLVAVFLLGILWLTSWAAVRRFVGNEAWKAWHWLVYPAMAAALAHVALAPFVGALGIVVPLVIALGLIALRLWRLLIPRH